MRSLLTVILIAFVAGAIGSGIGGALGVIIKKPKRFYIACMMALAAGIMIAISLFELLPESYEDGGIWAALIGLAAGAGLVFSFDIVVHTIKRKKGGDSNPVHASVLDGGLLEDGNESTEKRKLFKIGMAIFVAMMLHSIPEGIAIGAVYHLEMELSILLGIILLLHYVPEGLAIAVPLKASGMKNYKIILLTIASGLPALAGAILGYYIGMNETLIAYALSFAAGVMLFVSFEQMLPLAFEYGLEKHGGQGKKAVQKGHILTLLVIAGVVVAVVFTSLLH